MNAMVTRYEAIKERLDNYLCQERARQEAYREEQRRKAAQSLSGKLSDSLLMHSAGENRGHTCLHTIESYDAEPTLPSAAHDREQPQVRAGEGTSPAAEDSTDGDVPIIARANIP